MSVEEIVAQLTAIASVPRIRILALLHGETLHVSELARRVGMSRALLYMHLARLEEAGLVTGRHELSPEGKALKFYDVVPFEITVTPGVLSALADADPAPADDR